MVLSLGAQADGMGASDLADFLGGRPFSGGVYPLTSKAWGPPVLLTMPAAAQLQLVFAMWSAGYGRNPKSGSLCEIP